MKRVNREGFASDSEELRHVVMRRAKHLGIGRYSRVQNSHKGKRKTPPY
jgi:hypothetical protein